MESSHGEMKAWTCCPHVQRRRQEEGTSTPVRNTKGWWGKPQRTSSCAHTCTQIHSTQMPQSGNFSFAYPGNTGRRLKLCNFSTAAKAGRKSMAHLQDWDGQGWHSTGEPGWNMLPHALLPQPRALLGISMCPGISPTKKAQIPLEDSLWVLHASNTVQVFYRKLSKLQV